MNKYQVKITETNFYVSEVVGNNQAEAEKIAKDLIWHGRYKDFGISYDIVDVDSVREIIE